MRTKVYFLFTLIFVLNSASAQTNFAPLGATWHHSGTSAIYKTVSSNDTMILGHNCKTLKQSCFLPPTYTYTWLYRVTRNLYVYGTEDTVFIYNEVYNRFTPLYIFNVKAGDTLRLPYIRPSNCAYVMSDTSHASLAYVVDSVRDVNYDGVMLKTVYSKVLTSKNSYFGWCKFGDSINVYAQKIGAVNFGLLPNCLYNCAYTTGEDICPYLTDLVCYQDDSLNIKFKTTCIDPTWVNASIDEYGTFSSLLKPYPNPTLQSINLNQRGFDFKSTVVLSDVLGNIIHKQDFDKQSIIQLNVEHLVSGMYYVKIINQKNYEVGFTRFMKL